VEVGGREGRQAGGLVGRRTEVEGVRRDGRKDGNEGREERRKEEKRKEGREVGR